MGRFRLTIAILCVIFAAVCSFGALGAGSASALVLLDPPVNAADSVPATSYTGWAFASSSGATQKAWKWTSLGWQSATINVGQSFYMYPWSGSWMWAYRTGTWYAMHPNQVRVWKCNAVTTGGSNTILERTPVYKYNSRSSELLGWTRGGSRGCGNTHPEADLSRYAIPMCVPGLFCPAAVGERFVLSYVNPQPACSVPTEPGGIICMIAFQNNPRWAYVPEQAYSTELVCCGIPVNEPFRL